MALRLPRWHVVGHSWGAALALTYAASQPSALASLVLASPLISMESFVTSARACLSTLPRRVQETITRCERDGTIADPPYKQASALFEAHFVQRRPEPAYVTAYRQRTGVVTNMTLANIMYGPDEITCTGTLRSFDGEPLLPRVAVPTTVLCGRHDVMSAAAAAPLARHIPQAQVRTIVGAGHLTPLDAPDIFAQALRAHLAAVERW